MASTFAIDGYVLIEDAIAESDLESLKRELEQVVATACAEATADGGAWDSAASGADSSQCTYAFERDGSGALSLPRRVHKAQGVALAAPGVKRALASPRLAAAAARLCGTKAVDAFGTKYFPVRAKSIGSVGWHDDNYYFGTTSSQTISCVVYLVDNSAEKACLRVLPGSHRDAAVGYERAALYVPSLEQHGEYVPESVIAADERTVVDVPVRAGTAVLFDANLFHAVHPNSSDADSPRVAWHYIPSVATMAFRGTDFSRGKFADRHEALSAHSVAALNEQLVLAAKEGDAAQVASLLKQGADKDHAMYDGQDASVLGWAAKFGHIECVQILLAAGADVAAQDDTYATPLEMAVVRGHESVVQALVPPSVDAINRTRGEPTILHWLATNGCARGVQLCLDAGARPDGVDDEGRTACDWAREEDCAQGANAEVVRLLVRAVPN